MTDNPFATPAPAPMQSTGPLPPWGFFATIGWGVLALVLWFMTQTIAVIGILAWHGVTDETSPDLKKMMHDAVVLGVITILAGPVWIAVSALAARMRRWSVRDYLALVPPRPRELVFSIALLIVVLAASDLLAYATGRPLIPQFMLDAYNSAQTPLAMILLFVAIVIMAPLCEEIPFRGFLFRGLSMTRFGAPLAILLTSAAWALMHVQYDWFVIAQIFLLGLMFGWLRWATGSTVLTIVLHFITNLAAFTETAIKVHWFS